MFISVLEMLCPYKTVLILTNPIMCVCLCSHMHGEAYLFGGLNAGVV